jgi:hypothetical protein
MAKIQFGAALTAEGGVTVDPRHNICTSDGVYFTTVRAATADEALAQAKKDNPGVELKIQESGKTHKQRHMKLSASPRHNIFTASGEYFTTVRASSEEEALAQAKQDNPGVELICCSQLPG